MNEFLNVPNPEEKIKNIVKEALLRKQKEADRVQNELKSLKQQQESGVYYTPINTNPKSTIEFVAVTIVSLLTDILHGLKEGVEFVKQDVNNIQKGDINKIVQNGGKSNSEISKQSMANKIDKDADELLNMIGGAVEKANTAINPQVTTATKTSTTTSQPGDSASLGEQPTTLSGVAFSKAKDVGEAGIKTGIKWSAEALSNFIDYVMTLTGEESILETPIDKLSPGLNTKVILIAGILKELSTNPATKQAIKEIAKAFAITMDEFIDEIREPTIEIAGHAIDMMKNVAVKFVSGVTATTITVIQAFLAEIPWLGGIIDLFIAIGKGFNTLMATYKIFVGKSSPILLTGATTINNTKKMMTNGAERIKNTAQKSMKDIQTAIQSATGAVEPVTTPEPPTATATATAPIETTPASPWIQKKKANGDIYWKNEETNAVTDIKPDVQSAQATTPAPVTAPAPATTPVTAPATTPVTASPWVQQKGLNGNIYWKNEKTGKVSDTNPDEQNPTTPSSSAQSGGTININNAIMRGGKRLRRTMKLFHNTLPKLKYTCVNKHCKLNKNKSKKRKRNKSRRL